MNSEQRSMIAKRLEYFVGKNKYKEIANDNSETYIECELCQEQVEFSSYQNHYKNLCPARPFKCYKCL